MLAARTLNIAKWKLLFDYYSDLHLIIKEDINKKEDFLAHIDEYINNSGRKELYEFMTLTLESIRTSNPLLNVIDHFLSDMHSIDCLILEKYFTNSTLIKD